MSSMMINCVSFRFILAENCPSLVTETILSTGMIRCKMAAQEVLPGAANRVVKGLTNLKRNKQNLILCHAEMHNIFYFNFIIVKTTFTLR